MIILYQMSISYNTYRPSCPRLQELPTVTATHLKHSTADVLNQVSAGKPVAITRHDKARAVLLSVEQYNDLIAGESSLLAELKTEYRTMLDEMQSPEQKEAAIRSFNATSEELGAAAVKGAQQHAAQMP
jgi:prevent-host-death family protein